MQPSIFISYSHRNSEWLEKILIHLAPLKRKLGLRIFSDKEIQTDEAWRARIQSEIEHCASAVLLISPDFLASDFIANHELPRLFGRRESKNIQIFMIFLDHCAYKLEREISEYQAFNNPDEPLSAISETEANRVLSSLCLKLAEFGAKPNDRIGTSDRAIDWERLPEIDYSLTDNQRVFSDVKVSIPRLIVSLNGKHADGFTFDRCWLSGPAVVYCPYSLISGTNLHHAGDIDSLAMRPVSKKAILGAVPMSHLRLTNSQTTDIAFVDLDGNFLEDLRKDLAAARGD